MFAGDWRSQLQPILFALTPVNLIHLLGPFEARATEIGC
jgi:hypothetical protein